ncbi:SDR family oxidoreductase [Myxococcus sp. K38C18041901]|uniref:SDR family oxidoreductase n=1 Tax=Myxococcus guangdongensis TaxID=2906760 RepID=UPI0020A72393|nr:SDR family oxidoreductase [Myxococcus guangdongensis]MCP3063681.1 SDR family oxidoreductase [Myxococcus guangdongensis]
MTLEQQHVVVVGGSSGIGLGVARAALAQGASVTLASRSSEKLARAADLLGSPEQVRTCPVDATSEDSVRQLFGALGPVNHVVVTAVEARYLGIREMDFAAARRIFDSKLMAAFHVASHARIQPGGSLVFTTGIASLRPKPNGSVIAAVNGAIEAAVRAWALELAPVRVNALSPGWIDTPVWDAIVGESKGQVFEQHARRLPVGRIGTTLDVGHAALFLMGNGFTTGEVLRVDGGHPLV